MTADQTGDVRVLMEQVAKALVSEPDKVEVQTVDENGETVVELRVAESDLGKVIGKSGRTARAMRILLGAAGIKQHKRFTLEILE
jgi:predicted RNA-binding protein YlqC (UPF0109 family)